MSWKLYLDDDVENRPTPEGYVRATSTVEAIALVTEKGLPSYMSLDHDLGNVDTTMDFLKWFVYIYEAHSIPRYKVHSANPVGAQNIISFLESYRKFLGTSE